MWTALHLIFELRQTAKYLVIEWDLSQKMLPAAPTHLTQAKLVLVLWKITA